jgi:hypothetical protein
LRGSFFQELGMNKFTNAMAGTARCIAAFALLLKVMLEAYQRLHGL